MNNELLVGIIAFTIFGVALTIFIKGDDWWRRQKIKWFHKNKKS